MSDEDLLLEALIEVGAIELLSVTDDGEPLYRVTPLCEDVCPELYRIHERTVGSLVHSLWLRRLLEVSFSSSGSQVAYTTESGRALYEEVRNDLTDEERRMFLTVLSLESAR